LMGRRPLRASVLGAGGQAFAAMDRPAEVAITTSRRRAIPVRGTSVSANFQAQSEGRTSDYIVVGTLLKIVSETETEPPK